jgi:hypothetical protein
MLKVDTSRAALNVDDRDARPATTPGSIKLIAAAACGPSRGVTL